MTLRRKLVCWYQAGTDWVKTVTSGSYTRSTPLRSDSSFGYKYDVLHSASTQWGTTTLASFKAQYTDVRGWRVGQDSGSASGTPAGSWSKLLNLGDGYKSGSGTYDGYGQLTGTGTPAWQATAGSQNLGRRTISWAYDLAGNRQTEADGEVGTTTYSTADTNPNAVGTLNEYESITGGRPEAMIAYDADGNLTQDGTWTYAYDGENRLISATKSTQTLTFAYDYMGRRIRKTVSGTGAYDTKFLWSRWTLAAELLNDGITPQKVFVRGLDFSDAQGNAGGAGSLLAQIGGPSATTVSYAIPDAYGSIVGYMVGGSIVGAVEFSPYGKGINSYGTWNTYPYGFHGQYMDWEIGMVYYGKRHYAPKHGRFISRDPIEEAGGNNLYNFVRSGPTRGWDILGLTAGPIKFFFYSGFNFVDTETTLTNGGAGLRNYTITAGPYISPQTGKVVGGEITSWKSNGSVTTVNLDAFRSQPSDSGAPAPNSVTSFYSPGTDSWNAVAPGGLSTATASERRLQQQASFAEFTDNFATLSGIVLPALAGAVLPEIEFGALLGRSVANPIPTTLARVVGGKGPFPTLGGPGATDVFVTDAAAVRGLTPPQITQRLTISPSPTYTVIEFPTPAQGVATPVFRTNPGFLQGGRTLGGAPEFVVPNGPIPPGSTITIVGP